MKQLGVSTQLFGESLLAEDHLRLIRDAGFQLLEIFAAPGHFEWQDRDYVAYMAKLIHDLGMGVYSLHAPWAPGQDIAAVEASQRQASIEAVLRAVDALVTMEGRVLVLHPGATPSSILSGADQLELSRASIATVTAYCAGKGVLVALENPPPYELAGATAEMRALYQHFAPNPTLQACFDTGHAHITPSGVMCIIDIPKDILLVHLSDNAGESDDHLMPGSGTIAWNEFFNLLRQRDFDACLMLELTDTPRPDEALASGWTWMTKALESIS